MISSVKVAPLFNIDKKNVTKIVNTNVFHAVTRFEQVQLYSLS